MKQRIIGVDIGGTHVTAGLVDLEKGKLIRETYVRQHIDTSLEKEQVIHSWTSAIRQCLVHSGIKMAKIGIAMPGPFDYEKGISYIKGLHKYESLYNFNVKELLAKELGIDEDNIKFINDASAFLLGEMKAGAAKGFSNLVGITLGTGLGSAAYYNNNLEEGDLYKTAYEQGKCEDYLSARWLISTFEELAQKRMKGVKEIAEIAGRDSSARETFKRFGYNLSKALLTRYKRQSPQVVIIGGNIARAWELFAPAALQEMERSTYSFSLRPAALGEEAALVGAAYLWE